MENISAELKDNVLYINLGGRVDSTNANNVETEIFSYLDSMAHNAVIIDADNLDYISSAGLRVILKIKKTNDDLTIINVKSDVYEVFEMTGFSEMIAIEKAYRKLSVEGCELIGRGANGEVYRLDRDTIIKVYLNPDSLGDIKRERELARKAFVLGVPTAIPYDVVRVGNTYGSVFELLNAIPFSSILNEDPSKIDEIAKQCAELLKTIHSKEVKPEDMPNMKEVAIGWTHFLEKYLPADKYNKLLGMVTAVPESHHMMHGDFHTKNIMLQNGEVLLIDMDTLCQGDPIFEFASVYNAFVGFNICEKESEKPFLGMSHELCEQLYFKILELYFGGDKEHIESIHKKAMLMGNVRILRRTIKRVGFDDPFGAKIIPEIQARLEKLIDEVDSLNLGGDK